MKVSQSILATFGLLSLASATDKRWTNGTLANSTVWTTEVVTAYTTYCPSPTTVVANNHTYTVTSATTLTITNCPCTISSTVAAAPTTPAPSSPSGTSVGTTGNRTIAVGTAGSRTTTAPVFTGGAVAVGSSFGVLVLGGVAAMML